MSTTVIQQGPAYELSLAINATRHGHHVSLISFVPVARHPEHQVRFQTILTRGELQALRDAIGGALQDEAAEESLAAGVAVDTAARHGEDLPQRLAQTPGGAPGFGQSQL